MVNDLTPRVAVEIPGTEVTLYVRGMTTDEFAEVYDGRLPWLDSGPGDGAQPMTPEQQGARAETAYLRMTKMAALATYRDKALQDLRWASPEEARAGSTPGVISLLAAEITELSHYGGRHAEKVARFRARDERPAERPNPGHDGVEVREAPE